MAGRSNALSGFADANVTTPVIICPPYSSSFNGADLYSSIRMPSGVCPMLVLDPENAGMAAAKILALSDESIARRIRKIQKENQQTLFVADSDIRTKSYLSKIDQARGRHIRKREAHAQRTRCRRRIWRASTCRTCTSGKCVTASSATTRWF